MDNTGKEEILNIKHAVGLVKRNWRLFLALPVFFLALAFLVNQFSRPEYRITSSILINLDNYRLQRQEINNYLNSSLLLTDPNFQNEMRILKSSPVFEKTIENLDLQTRYYRRSGIWYVNSYKNVPFTIDYVKNHIQPVGVRFYISFPGGDQFYVRAESKEVSLYNLKTGKFAGQKKNWLFQKKASFGELIQTADLAFIVDKAGPVHHSDDPPAWYGFEFRDMHSLKEELMKKFQFSANDKQATVVEISLKTGSVEEGIDLANELMNVYSEQNLIRKNHIASNTIDYIESQLGEISDSLSQTEVNLQQFRSSNRVLDIRDQSLGISDQYINLQNRLAELLTQKRYYEYVKNYLEKNDDYSTIIVPASLGIKDQLLSNLMSDLVSFHSQRSNLIQNQQFKNPLVQKLGIQIENVKKTISENIAEVSRSTDIEIDEMEKRLSGIRDEISRLPETQRRLGNIERKYRLNDATYNYLMEKRAEAKISKASNHRENNIIEPARMDGIKPVSPKKGFNYLVALMFGLVIPFGFVVARDSLNSRIDTSEYIEQISPGSTFGIIPHSKFKTRHVVSEYPNSNIAESFRALRTNLDFYLNGGQKKVIMISSCLEKDGKTFIAVNLAISFAQLNLKTILVSFDLRKPQNLFSSDDGNKEGLSSYLNGTAIPGRIINNPQANLDYIVAGSIPANPAELIAGDKTNDLISILRSNYDIVILDTTPLAQVSDAYLLFKYSDINLIIVRQNKTLKNVFSLVMKNLKLRGILNIGIILNDNKINNEQYGYGTGYYHTAGKKEKVKKQRKKRRKHYYEPLYRL